MPESSERERFGLPRNLQLGQLDIAGKTAHGLDILAVGLEAAAESCDTDSTCPRLDSGMPESSERESFGFLGAPLRHCLGRETRLCVSALFGIPCLCDARALCIFLAGFLSGSGQWRLGLGRTPQTDQDILGEILPQPHSSTPRTCHAQCSVRNARIRADLPSCPKASA